MSVIVWGGLGKTVAAIFLSPAAGFVLALLLVLAVSWGFRKVAPIRADNIFRKVQFVSASDCSRGHGGNDAQKTMAIIAALLMAHGVEKDGFHVPLWVVLSCQAAMALGIFFGGRRIARTIGLRIIHPTPVQGVCAETAGSMTLFPASFMDLPVSITLAVGMR